MPPGRAPQGEAPGKVWASAAKQARRKSRIQLGAIGIVLGFLILVMLRGSLYGQVMALPALGIGAVFLVLGLSESA